MKKTFITILFALFTLCAYTQMNTGSYFVAANSSFNFGFTTTNDIDNDIKNTVLTYNLNPKIGYFIKNKLALGASLDFSSSASDTYDRTSRLLIGPFARYYMQYGTLIPFAEASVGVGYNKYIEKMDNETFKFGHSVFGASLGAGTDIFLNEKIALECMLKYQYEKQKPNYEGASGSGHAISGIIAYFGIVIFFESI